MLTIGFALTKGDKPELVVQKLTELGVDRIVPFVAERSVVRWDDDKAARNVERWRAIAREAAAQAHRPWLPEVAEVRPFAEVVAAVGAAWTPPSPTPTADAARRRRRRTHGPGRTGGWLVSRRGVRASDGGSAWARTCCGPRRPPSSPAHAIVAVAPAT